MPPKARIAELNTPKIAPMIWLPVPCKTPSTTPNRSPKNTIDQSLGGGANEIEDPSANTNTGVHKTKKAATHLFIYLLPVNRNETTP